MNLIKEVKNLVIVLNQIKIEKTRPQPQELKPPLTLIQKTILPLLFCQHEDTHTEQEQEHEDIPTEQELDHDDEIEETTDRDEEVELEDSGDRRYPIRSNRGKPKKQYELALKTKGRYSISNYVSPHRLARSHALMVEELTTTTIPSDVQEALNDERWKNAMNEEMEALQKNQTWELVKLPNGKKTVGCRWIYTIKLDSSGKVDRFKARLVAKGVYAKIWD